MMQKGAEALSDAELLAILIGSGNTEETAVTLIDVYKRQVKTFTAYCKRSFSRGKGSSPRR